MNSAIERLLSLRARDVMSRNVICVPASQTMAEAASILLEHKISGAPVVDDLGQCVGVLSSSDFLCSRTPTAACGPASIAEPRHVGVEEQVGGRPSIGDVSEDLVGHRMSPAAQTISADTAILDVARTMCGAHVHRLLVLDDGGRPAGVLSPLDVISAVVKAIEE